MRQVLAEAPHGDRADYR